MTPSNACYELIKGFEQCRLKPYNDFDNNATCGWGHLIHKGPLNGTELEKDGISQVVADCLLVQDVAVAAKGVNGGLNDHVPVSQNQFDALVSLTFNIGVQAFHDSTLLHLLWVGKFDEAAAQFPRWIYSGGRISTALISRRAKERMLFETT